MSLLLIVLCLLVAIFGFVLLFGAPYLPTLRKQTDELFELLELRPGQMLVELGSGDGRVLREAAKRGIYSVGYELNPLLVMYSYLRNFRYRRFITHKWANFWNQPLPVADGIYVFLLDRFMDRLHKKITQEISKPVKVVSFGFELPDKKPVTEKSGLYLYKFYNK